MGNDIKTADQVQPQTPVAPVAPVGLVNKEAAPRANISEIRPAGPEVKHEISQELQDLGVQEIRDASDLTFEHKQIGLEHSGAATPVQTVPTGLVQIPQTTDINSSSTWFNVLTEKVKKVLNLLGA